MSGALSLLVLLAVCTGAQRLLTRAVRAVWLAYEPLSGDHSDSVVYHRSLLTPGERDNRIIWVLIVAAALLFWLGLRQGSAWGWLGLVGLLAALGWDLWTWERAAVSVRRVSWRRGWRKSVRRVPVSQVAEVIVAEKAHPWLGGGLLGQRLGSCQLRLQLYTGDAVKLPRTSALNQSAHLEDVANFLRLQMGAADEEKRRSAQERRRRRPTGVPLADEEQAELRLRLQRLRDDTPAGPPTVPDSLPGPSLPAEPWQAESWPPDSEMVHSQPPPRLGHGG